MNENTKWDWAKMIPSWDYHALASVGWPGWEKRNSEPDSVALAFTHDGESFRSRDIAIEWDDLAEGQFYYRDYTADAMPFVGAGDKYESIFVFQLLRDAEKFRERYLSRILEIGA